MSCCSRCKSEFQIQNFKLNHQQPFLFVTSQCGPRLLYPIWTLIWTVYHCVWNFILVPVLLAEAGNLPEPTYFIFLTNWGYTFLTITVICDCIATLYVHIKRKDILEGTTHSMPWFLKALWVLFNTAGANAVLVTLGYYILLTPEFTAVSTAKHLLNSLYIVANTFVSAKPMRIFHVFHPIIFLVIYVIFSLIWHFAGGDPIYSVLDWTNVSKSVLVVCLLALIGTPVAYMTLFGCHKLRVLIVSLCCTKMEDLSLSDTRELKNISGPSKDDLSKIKYEQC